MYGSNWKKLGKGNRPGRQMTRKLNREGIPAKQLGDEAVYTFSPPIKSNYYTGGINGKVYMSGKDPGHAYIMPSDVYDIFGGKFDMLVKKGLGLKNTQLNLMGVKRIKLPNPEHWGTTKRRLDAVSKGRDKFEETYWRPYYKR